MKALDISGERFGRLVALHASGFDVQPSRNHIKWLCQCDCGAKFEARLNGLRSGHAKSCGCIKKSGEHSAKHRLTQTPEYSAWAHMKSRCQNKNNQDYSIYGGRGITVSDSWADSFENFLSDMGKKPEGMFSIDRIDTNGNYEAGNCRWADNHTQSRNKRNNRFLSVDGVRMCLQDWATHLGINSSSLIERLNKWPTQKALTTTKGE